MCAGGTFFLILCPVLMEPQWKTSQEGGPTKLNRPARTSAEVQKSERGREKYLTNEIPLTTL